MNGELIRIRGTVQGVGFRPTVARIARQHGLPGWVRNDAEGVLIALGGEPCQRDAFLDALLGGLPPLAHVASVDRAPSELDVGDSFSITTSERAAPRTAVTPDAATCPACLDEVRDPDERRYRYPFASCTHCGPRFSVVTGIPWDRPNTTLVGFPLCPGCEAEYRDELDRRYHAQPLACPTCGPQAWLERAGGAPDLPEVGPTLDDVDAAARLILAGEILAVKGLGGYHLICDATNAAAVDRLRARKHRPHKPFALMVRDLDVLRRFADVPPDAEAVLTSPAAPIVLLPANGEERVADGVAPGQRRLGAMLPTTPLHHVLLQDIDRPIVCTSGNVVDEPQCTDDDDARARLSGIADWLLVNDRPIAHRVDDSVVHRVDGAPQVIRRARGYAPAPLPLPPGLGGAPSILAMGTHLKNTLGLCRDREVVLSQHLGDLDDLKAFGAWQHALHALMVLYEHRPDAIAVDPHPEYRSTQIGTALARRRGIPVVEVQHHHAHIAACMAEHRLPADGPPVLGLALDGLGLGDDGTLWGGEALRCTYADSTRVGSIAAVPLLGGDRAAREPWRNLYAHLLEILSWDEIDDRWGPVPAIAALRARRTPLITSVLASGHLSPRSSSAGRLFDAVAAALDLFPDHVDDEGQAAIALEALITPDALAEAVAEPLAYRVAPGPLPSGLPGLTWDALWPTLLDDRRDGVEPAVISARFHVGLAEALVALAESLRPDEPIAALSGGCWQNVVLTDLVAERLRARGWRVLVHRALPPNDGGVAYGQAVVAAARQLTPGA